MFELYDNNINYYLYHPELNIIFQAHHTYYSTHYTPHTHVPFTVDCRVESIRVSRDSCHAVVGRHAGVENQGWVSRSQIVSQNLRSICDKHTIRLRLEKRVTGKDRKALVIHTHAQRTRSIYDDIPTFRVPDGSRRMLAVYERNQR